MADNTIKLGEYIVIQKQNYKKLHKFNKPNSVVNIGKDAVNLKGIEGNRYFSIFKMIPHGTKRNKEYRLELAEETCSLKQEITLKASGADNRNIYDDGRSQKLSAVEIDELKFDSNKASDIVETIITNSTTFHNKTEFSQEKYLKKKEKKYFEYVQILKPNLRNISEIMYKLEPNKIQGIRLDTLSQIITLSNVSCEGNHLLYDSGSNGLLAAALLGAMGSRANGKLVHMHPGNMSQKQALLAMNFETEQYNKCISVNVYSVLRQLYQGCDTHTVEKEDSTLKRKAVDELEHDVKVSKLENTENATSNVDIVNTGDENKLLSPKKPKWHFDNIAASEVLSNKVDSLVVASKEDPQNIFLELLPFVKPGRPFVIYYSVAEPLQSLYITLKCLSNVAALKLTCNWMRNYQILPERTHPEVMMNSSSGFLLTGYVLQ
ncbi:tRNA (adenine(58)-N(1))-methyltransferase non-catalytic subunit TRM6 [Danaus plexippus]|uniref:tRNA (adenine(58)-N(1))-methyltransferase non-catalytic subunit TRM6 n=1 Tax=Danaus plexippus TaxID=13037 RepID=UPI002AB0FF7D|nr:tRNA (adenine(58)-N(1))-methyltransferase non-catalytic subunit TRM6 [Danaus plexippus]XP_061382849.1 tRNA (adenine(58)-N(1))-methyltransferase non-catalytic subunit TRM6 [Danaus plexippus]